MKKTLLFAGIIAGLVATNGYAEEDTGVAVARAARVGPRVTNTASNTPIMPQNPGNLDMVRPGEVLGAGESGWMACPPDCSFLRNSNGNLSVPLTCVSHGIECPGGSRGVRFYEDYPTQYATDVTSIGEIQQVTTNNASVKKADTVTTARVAKKLKPISTNVKPQVQDMAADGGAIAINCPAGCTPDCAILGNTVLCECKASDGSTCKAEVVVADDATVVK